MGREALRAAAAEAKKAEAATPKRGTSLDAVVEQMRRDPPDQRGRDQGRRRDRLSPVRETKRRKSVVEIMQERAQSRTRSDQEESRRKESKKKKKKRKHPRRSRSRRRKAKEVGESSSSSAESSASSSSAPDFRSASARGGELWRIAQKKPGRLAQLSLDEMTRYLAGRNEMGGRESYWRGEKVLAYLNQVILSHHPASQVGIRNLRELTTLAMAVDYILEGDYVRSLDLLIQRFKAVEASLGESGWHMAKHLELIPPSTAALTTLDEKDMAAKAELRNRKLQESLAKARKTK